LRWFVAVHNGDDFHRDSSSNVVLHPVYPEWFRKRPVFE
jgi:hypothetical protein